MQRWHLLKSHTCGEWHACSAEHATIVTPAAAAAVMVTIIIFLVDQTTEGSKALLTWYTNHRNMPWIYKWFNENSWREIPKCCIHKHYFSEIPFSSPTSAPRLNSSAPLRYIGESLTTAEEPVIKRRRYSNCISLLCGRSFQRRLLPTCVLEKGNSDTLEKTKQICHRRRKMQENVHFYHSLYANIRITVAQRTEDTENAQGM